MSEYSVLPDNSFYMKMKIKLITLLSLLPLFFLNRHCCADGEYSYLVRKGDTLSEITLMFSGSHDYFKVAESNDISNPDLIFPGDMVHISQKRPIRSLGKYLESIYSDDFKAAYAALSSLTASWYSYEEFTKSFDLKPDYDLSTIKICADFYVDGRHYLQMEIQHYEDPAKWGFTLVRERYKWYIVLFDKNPVHPLSNGYLEWKCD